MKIASVIDSQIVAVVAGCLGKHFPALEGYAEIGNMLSTSMDSRSLSFERPHLENSIPQLSLFDLSSCAANKLGRRKKFLYNQTSRKAT
jgi:hypothetical protein